MTAGQAACPSKRGNLFNSKILSLKYLKHILHRLRDCRKSKDDGRGVREGGITDLCM